MENMRNRRKIDIVTDAKRLSKFAAQPTFKSFTIIHEEMVAIDRYQANVCLNRPIYVGFSVLDLSKILMYNWHYKEMTKLFPDPQQFQLLYTDTDSLVYKIKTNNIYKAFSGHPELFDFSGYEKEHKCSINNPYLVKNKKRIGVMKDELNGMLMTEFVGLRSKLYSFKIAKEDKLKAKKQKIINQKCKGIKKNVVKNDISHQHYKQCLMEEKQLTVKINTLRSQKHQIQTIQQHKRALFYYDDKIYMFDDRITTKPYGHYKNL